MQGAETRWISHQMLDFSNCQNTPLGAYCETARKQKLRTTCMKCHQWNSWNIGRLEFRSGGTKPLCRRVNSADTFLIPPTLAKAVPWCNGTVWTELSVLIQQQAGTEETGSIEPAQARPLITCLFQYTSALPRNECATRSRRSKSATGATGLTHQWGTVHWSRPQIKKDAIKGPKKIGPSICAETS